MVLNWAPENGFPKGRANRIRLNCRIGRELHRSIERVYTVSKWIPVLVVDDDEVVRMALKYKLKLYGFKVYLAEDGPIALKLARQKRPKLILLDWMMPDMDGLEVLSELKHDRRTEHIPVFMLTGRGVIADLDQAFDVGVDDYIKKPFNLMELGRIVKDKWEQYIKRTRVGKAR